jgi:hypothetical protein
MAAFERGEPMIRGLAMVAGAALLVTGCSREPEPVASETAAAGPAVAEETLPGSTATAAPVASATPAALEIPRGMRGRFGLVPADCTTKNGDEKGLVTVSARELRFYESVAELAEAEVTSASLLEGRFAYSGEGMEWSRKARLELKDGGRTLVLQEFGEDAVPGPEVFTRCPA